MSGTMEIRALPEIGQRIRIAVKHDGLWRPLSIGELILTNRRLIFRGSQKSISCAWNKLLDIQFFADGIRFSQTSRSKPVTVQFHQRGNVEVIGSLISYIANHSDGSQ